MLGLRLRSERVETFRLLILAGPPNRVSAAMVVCPRPTFRRSRRLNGPQPEARLFELNGSVLEVARKLGMIYEVRGGNLRS